jgi:hypothetical protein
MPILINNADLERHLETHAKRQPVPTTKGRLATQIIRSVLAAADARGIDAGRQIERLQVKRETQTTAAA